MGVAENVGTHRAGRMQVEVVQLSVACFGVLALPCSGHTLSRWISTKEVLELTANAKAV